MDELNVSQVIECTSAAPLIRLLIVVQVQPGVGCQLPALDHRHGCMHGAGVDQLWVVVQSRRPQQGSTLLRLHGDVQQRKRRLPTLLHV